MGWADQSVHCCLLARRQAKWRFLHGRGKVRPAQFEIRPAALRGCRCQEKTGNEKNGKGALRSRGLSSVSLLSLIFVFYFTLVSACLRVLWSPCSLSGEHRAGTTERAPAAPAAGGLGQPI